jgi:outer membrane protein TolC
VEFSQSIFDGGMVRQQRLALAANAKAQESELEVELHFLEERINQLFFGILLLDAQGKQLDLLQRDIQLGIETTEAAIANGTALKSNLEVLRAELLSIDQRDVELSSLRHAYVEMLGALIDRKLDDDIKLEIPATPDLSSEIRRPELRLFQNQTESAALHSGLLRTRTLPKLSLFLQGGYGRPALNMLSNDPEPYYIGGLRLNWSLSGLYTVRNEKEEIRLAQRSIAVRRETFLFNTDLELKQQNADIDRYDKLLATDKEIVELRTRIKNTASVQLENGVITASDYLEQVNAEDQARQNKNIHEIQKLMAEYAVATTKGIPVHQ